MNSLPKTVTRQRRDCDLNPGPSAPESSTLTTRLPSHPQCQWQPKKTGGPTWTLKAPNCPWKSKPAKAMLKTCDATPAMTQQKNVCQLSVLVQNDDRSSMANSRPPIGAWNPADTPAATPAVVNSRLHPSIHHTPAFVVHTRSLSVLPVFFPLNVTLVTVYLSVLHSLTVNW